VFKKRVDMALWDVV